MSFFKSVHNRVAKRINRINTIIENRINTKASNSKRKLSEAQISKILDEVWEAKFSYRELFKQEMFLESLERRSKRFHTAKVVEMTIEQEADQALKMAKYGCH